MSDKCAELSELISAFADGELDAAGRARVEGHLADCAECRARLEAYRRLDAAAADVPPPPPVDDLRWRAMLSQVKAAGSAPRRNRIHPIKAIAFVASLAAACVFLAVGLPTTTIGDPPPFEHYRSAQSVTIEYEAENCAVIPLAVEGGLNALIIAEIEEEKPDAEAEDKPESGEER